MNRRQFLQITGSAAACAGAGFWSSSAHTQSGSVDASAVLTPEVVLAGPPRGPWRRLFLDAAVVEATDGLARVFHAAEKRPTPVITRDKPWEGVSAITGPYVYGTAFWDGGKLRMWYEVHNKGTHTGYAESRDGITWTKPDLGIIEFEGSKANTLVISAFQREVTGGQCHNASVIKCPWASDPAKRYALYGFDTGSGHARVAFSPDGLHWRYAPETEKKPLFTSSDVVNFFWDAYHSRYAVTWKSRNRRGRAVGIAWSQDGLTWTKPIDGPVFVADDLDPDATQIYGMPVFPYQGLYVGLPWPYNARYFKYGEYSVKKLHEAQEDSPRTMDTQLAWSWDLINWTRPPERAQFIPRGAKGAWDGGMICTARAPVIVGDQLFFYYGGCDGVHDEPRVNAAIGLATLRLDGFCSMRAGEHEGWFISRREPFRTPQVTINAKTASDGYVTAEILDRRNRVMPGFARQDCIPFTGDSVRHVLKSKSTGFQARDLDADKKIRFWLKNTDLYSYLPNQLTPQTDETGQNRTAGP